jgi:hypothetical protein
MHGKAAASPRCRATWAGENAARVKCAAQTRRDFANGTLGITQLVAQPVKNRRRDQPGHVSPIGRDLLDQA